jgi:hypothetical protein
VLGDLWKPKKLRLQSLSTKGKKASVRVQRRNFRGKGEEKRGMGGDRGQSRNKTKRAGQKENNLFGSRPRTKQKRPKNSAVQARVPATIRREKSQLRNAW